MKVPGPRPRFKFQSQLAGTEITKRISDRLREENPCELWLKNAHYHITLNFPRRTAQAWTPQMDINFEDLGNGRTLVRCLIGPGPGIWMLFAAGYVGLTLLGLTGITLGLAQQLLHETPWGFFFLPFVLAGAGTMVYLERTGRARAQNDMRVLKDTVDRALECDCLKLAEEQAL
ncbi:MAG: hypothetical protein IPG92_12780 [Flavobacteriales bacterium]|nr:hypothetical protein [Flavobacteriales bacterium]